MVNMLLHGMQRAKEHYDEMIENLNKMLDLKRMNGTLQQKVENGIKVIMKNERQTIC